MRKLEEYEEVGLIGYPNDGDYIAVMDRNGDRARLLGGELCQLDGATLAHQATTLPKYCPQASHLVIATIKGDRLVAIRDYQYQRTGFYHAIRLMKPAHGAH